MNIKALKVIVVTAGLTVILGGCETLDAYTQKSKTSSATKGALIGAAAGAVVGLASGGDAVERRADVAAKRVRRCWCIGWWRDRLLHGQAGSRATSRA